MKETAVALVAVAFIVMCGIIVAGKPIASSAKKHEADHWKADAVRHGCADFSIADTLTGETQFQWRNK